jgi:small subunit ribosomal protein S18
MAPRRSGKSKGRGGRRKTRKDDGGPRKRLRYLEGVKDIDPNDHDFLRKFLTDHGKIVSARLTGATARQQRQIKRAVRRARVMGLLP